VGLIARQVEAAGIPALCMGSAYDIMRAVNPPRGAFLDFPLGHTAGKPDQPELQRQILIEALEAFNSLTEPGSIKILPFQWGEDEVWREAIFSDRLPRHETPQYQNEEDRRRAEANELSALAFCGCEVCAGSIG